MAGKMKPRGAHANTPAPSRPTVGPKGGTGTPPDQPEEMKPEGPFINLVVRRRVAHVRADVTAHLVKSGNYDWASARAKVDSLEDEDILNFGKKQGFDIAGDGRVGALGDGTLLQWLIDHKDQILQLIMAIVSIFTAFATLPEAPAPVPTLPEAPAPVPTQAKAEPEEEVEQEEEDEGSDGK